MFTELVVSNITRLIDLPGTELAQLMGEVELKLPGGAGPASGFFRSLMSLKRKGRRCVCEGWAGLSCSLASLLNLQSLRSYDYPKAVFGHFSHFH